ncbi:formimidoylglutamate deiminase [Microtetraspora sp. NBRC 16547]|uniref:formimidoylglutamate deiminase n=1 Tax=Microtetraspora sp. NBRC 16547 TaxID=3030993 RepID=UPI0024A35EFE|nr:formimidoylglutamate deiminase [Microtetraspora sp. NBRC 16547]GLX01327.1 formimidoylglutamate deiminase [Microtetraspora sp. NBRC 16547]
MPDVNPFADVDGGVIYWCEMAWLPPGEVVECVSLRVEGTRITHIQPEVPPPPGAVRLAGLTLPGLANAHSHAFHRALRGHTQAERGTFWTWREQMYGVAAQLDPDRYLALARAAFAEMSLAGITCVGEFHYLHHGPGGVPYDDPNAMGHALIEAARDAGLRIALLDTCYLTGAIGHPLAGTQLRFGDGDAVRWADRVELLGRSLRTAEDVVIGAAIHSIRAVPPEQMCLVAEFANRHAIPLHAHVSEQRAENQDCVEAYSATPVQLLHQHGALGPRSTAVHATHLSDVDIALLGGSTTHVCMCPTTERDLADGIGRARRLLDGGSPITLGSDSHAVIDLFEEARAVELDERLATRERGHFRAAELLDAATAAGHASLGFPDAGMLVPGAWADLVSVRLDSVRTAGATKGTAAETVVFAASAGDVHSVVSGGRRVVEDGRHMLGDVGALLRDAVADVRRWRTPVR